MKSLRYFDKDADYQAIKNELDYPTVSYTKDKDEVYYKTSNLIGKFIDDSTEEDWYWTIDSEQIPLYVNPETKKFSEEYNDTLTDCYYIFANTKLEKLDKFPNTSNVIDMKSMFDGCTDLTSVNASGWDTSNVTNMVYMFWHCYNLTSLDLSSFDTSNVTNMKSMFNECTALTSLNINNFNTSNVTDMYGIFITCESLTSLDLSNWNTSNVTDFGWMFQDCTALTSLNLSNFDTSNATNMGKMFEFCNKLSNITCKQAFKDWCWTNQDAITLPNQMRSGGSGTWIIVD